MTARLGLGRRSVAGALAVCLAAGASAYGQDDKSSDVSIDRRAANPPAAAAAPHGGTKNRYVSFNPNNGAMSVAFQVTLLGPNLVAWVNEPVLRTDRLVDPQWVADLVTSPAGDGSDLLRDWSSYTDPTTGANVVHIRGCAIFPNQSYDIRALDSGGALTGAVNFGTTPTPPISGSWADCVGNFNPATGLWAGPDGVTNFKDIAAVLHQFQHEGTAPVTWTDLAGEIPNYVMNFHDISAAIEGFAGVGYWFNVVNHASVVDCVTPAP